MLTMHPEHVTVSDALAAGARGYLLKESSPLEIRSALAAVTSGNAVLGAGVARQMLDALSRPPGNPLRLGGLTQREDEVLELLAGGLTNREIAARLYLSDKTVRNYVSALFTKLHVTDRGGAVARARDLGYGSG
jgi:DNA-binding NarL/FixJ family response regulator